jgi:Protein of unknown function (DUF3309)
MSLGVFAVVFMVLLLLLALPIWNHSCTWSYWPSGGVGLLLAIVVVLAFMGRI